MVSRAEKLPGFLDIVSGRVSRPINIIETGTIRNVDPKYLEGDGHSTLYIAKWCEAKLPVKHQFYSVDLDTRVCKAYMRELGLDKYVKLITSNSLDWLGTIDFPIDFAFLDSANDDTLILNEFKAITPKLAKGGVVIIDDVIPGSGDVIKGRKLLPYLRKEKIPYRLVGRYCVVGE